MYAIETPSASSRYPNVRPVWGTTRTVTTASATVNEPGSVSWNRIVPARSAIVTGKNGRRMNWSNASPSPRPSAAGPYTSSDDPGRRIGSKNGNP